MSVSAEDEPISGYLDLVTTRTSQGVTVELPVDERLIDNGRVHPLAVFMAVDMVAGMTAGFASLPRWVVTSDMSVDIHGWTACGCLRATGSVVRVSRRRTLVEVAVVDAEGRRVVTASVDHALVEVTSELPFVDMVVGDRATGVRPSWHAQRAVDAFAVAEAGGEWSIAVDEHTRNPWGILHGAATAHLAIHAATMSGIADVDHVTLRYLGRLADGRAVASPRVVHGDEKSTAVAVEIRGAGREDLTAIGYVRGTGRA